MTRVISFGGYTFADTGVALRDNFTELALRETRLAGLDGALDECDTGAAGRITYEFWLKSATAGAMADLRDAIKQLALLGAQTLVITPEAGKGNRYTQARIIKVDLPELYANQPTRNQKATITWAAVTPRWYGVDQPAGSGVTHACAGTATNFSLTQAGTAAAYPVITVEAKSAVSVVRIQRIISGVVVDDVHYGGILALDDVLTINTRTLAVTKNGADAYQLGFVTQGGGWFRLMPNSNAVRVVLGSGESADVNFVWENTYF